MSSDDETQENDLGNPEVTTKYTIAAKVTNEVLAIIVAECLPGARIVELCERGDSLIREELAKVYKKKKTTERGVAFPTCISVNNIVANFSPLRADTMVLKENDVVKVELGAHLDGYIATAGHTFVCGASGEALPAKVADVIQATQTAAECVVRLLRPGKSSTEICDIIDHIGELYDVKPVEKVVSYSIRRFTPDGDKQFSNGKIPPGEDKLECGDIEFEEGEAYCVDIKYSTGEGTMKLSEHHATVFKRDVDAQYQLKTRAARTVFSIVNKNFPTLPFTLRAVGDDEKVAKFGIKEMANHELVQTYNITQDKNDDAFVTCARFTVLLTSSQTLKLAPDLEHFAVKSDKHSDALADQRIKEVLAMSTKRSKKKKGKGKKRPNPDTEETAEKMVVE